MRNTETTGSGVPSRRTAPATAGAGTRGVGGVTSIVEGLPAGSAPVRTYACALTPEPAEDPYHLPPEIVRKTIAEGRPGLPMALRVRVMDAVSGDPIPGAVLEVWHGDALGVYSGHTSLLRGAQRTDDHGYAEFSTIFPGWYAGRAVHVRAEAHIGGCVEGGSADGGHVAHTGQLFVAEELTRAVAKLAPYRGNPTTRTTNDQDRHYHAGGAGMLTVVPRDRYQLSLGLLATVTVAVERV